MEFSVQNYTKLQLYNFFCGRSVFFSQFLKNLLQFWSYKSVFQKFSRNNYDENFFCMINNHADVKNLEKMMLLTSYFAPYLLPSQWLQLLQIVGNQGSFFFGN